MPYSMLDIADLEFFKVVSEAHSLAAAARELKVSAPAVSQRVNLLERRIGLPLFERKDQKSKLTDAGCLLATRGRIILSNMHTLKAELENRRGIRVTPMRVLVPTGSAGWFISQQALGFIKSHPETKLEVNRNDPLPGKILQTDNWDIMVFSGDIIEGIHSERLEQRKISSMRVWLVAAPSYIAAHGEPLTPESLQHHVCATKSEVNENDSTNAYQPYIEWQLVNQQGNVVNIKMTSHYSSNDFGLLHDWCAGGMGIIARPEATVVEEVMSGSLVRVLPDWDLPKIDVIAICRKQSLYFDLARELMDRLKNVMLDRVEFEWDKFTFDDLMHLS